MTDDEEKTLMEKTEPAIEETDRELVVTEGADITALVMDPDDACRYGVRKTVGRHYKLRPCGKPPLAVLQIRTPGQPGGVRLAPCRGCVGRLTTDCVNHLSFDPRVLPTSVTRVFPTSVTKESPD